MIILRDDQFKLKQDIYSEWNNGARNVLAVLPTGGGKSVVVSDIVQDEHNLGAVQCIMAHRVELVGQLSGHVADRGIKHRIIAPRDVVSLIIAKHRLKYGRSYVNPDANCAVAGVDTLLARKVELASWCNQVDSWKLDEAHHALQVNKWGEAVALFPNARGLGVTASPTRADGMGLGRHADGVFDVMVQGPTMRELIQLGALSDYEIAIPESDYEIGDDAITGSGDYSPKKMREASKKSHIVGDVVIEYVKRALFKKFICFATDVETATEIAAQFNAAGIRVAAVSAKTPNAVRDDYVERLKDGRLLGLINVDLFGEGFDVPSVEVVIMARPTASLGVFLQQFGRALRMLAGKPYGLVIDHVSNWKRHGFPDKAHLWTLDRREKRAKKEKDPEEIDLTACRGCSRPYEKFYPACPYCGWEPPLVAVASRTLEMVAGDLFLLDRAKIAEMHAATKLDSPADVANRAAYVAGSIAGAGAANRQMERHAAQQRLTEALNQWAGCQRALGRPDQQTYRRFYLTTGVDVLSALTLPRADMEALASKVEGWYS